MLITKDQLTNKTNSLWRPTRYEDQFCPSKGWSH